VNYFDRKRYLCHRWRNSPWEWHLLSGIPPLAPRARLPGVAGLLLSGVVIGPHGFGIFVAFKTFDPPHQPLVDHRLLDIVFVLMVTTAILGPVLTEYFAPRMLEHVEVGDHESRGRGWKGGQPG
jgi:hypothetical protein